MPNNIENRPHATYDTPSASASINNPPAVSNANNRHRFHASHTVSIPIDNLPPYLDTDRPPSYELSIEPSMNDREIEVIPYSDETGLRPPPYTEGNRLFSLSTPAIEYQTFEDQVDLLIAWDYIATLELSLLICGMVITALTLGLICEVL